MIKVQKTMEMIYVQLENVLVESKRPMDFFELLVLRLADTFERITWVEVLNVTTMKKVLKQFINNKFEILTGAGYLDICQDYNPSIFENNLKRIQNELYSNVKNTDSIQEIDYYFKISSEKIKKEIEIYLSEKDKIKMQYKITSEGKMALTKKNIITTEYRSFEMLMIPNYFNDGTEDKFVYAKRSDHFNDLKGIIIGTEEKNIFVKELKKFFDNNQDKATKILDFDVSTRGTKKLIEQQKISFQIRNKKQVELLNTISGIKSLFKDLFEKYFKPERFIEIIQSNLLDFSTQSEDSFIHYPKKNLQIIEDMTFLIEYYRIEQMEILKNKFKDIFFELSNKQYQFDWNGFNIEIPLEIRPGNKEMMKEFFIQNNSQLLEKNQCMFITRFELSQQLIEINKKFAIELTVEEIENYVKELFVRLEQNPYFYALDELFEKYFKNENLLSKELLQRKTLIQKITSSHLDKNEELYVLNLSFGSTLHSELRMLKQLLQNNITMIFPQSLEVKIPDRTQPEKYFVKKLCIVPLSNDLTIVHYCLIIMIFSKINMEKKNIDSISIRELMDCLKKLIETLRAISLLKNDLEIDLSKIDIPIIIQNLESSIKIFEVCVNQQMNSIIESLYDESNIGNSLILNYCKNNKIELKNMIHKIEISNMDYEKRAVSLVVKLYSVPFFDLLIKNSDPQLISKLYPNPLIHELLSFSFEYKKQNDKEINLNLIVNLLPVLDESENKESMIGLIENFIIKISVKILSLQNYKYIQLETLNNYINNFGSKIFNIMSKKIGDFWFRNLQHHEQKIEDFSKQYKLNVLDFEIKKHLNEKIGIKAYFSDKLRSKDENNLVYYLDVKNYPKFDNEIKPIPVTKVFSKNLYIIPDIDVTKISMKSKEVFFILEYLKTALAPFIKGSKELTKIEFNNHANMKLNQLLNPFLTPTEYQDFKSFIEKLLIESTKEKYLKEYDWIRAIPFKEESINNILKNNLMRYLENPKIDINIAKNTSIIRISKKDALTLFSNVLKIASNKGNKNENENQNKNKQISWNSIFERELMQFNIRFVPIDKNAIPVFLIITYLFKNEHLMQKEKFKSLTLEQVKEIIKTEYAKIKEQISDSINKLPSNLTLNKNELEKVKKEISAVLPT